MRKRFISAPLLELLDQAAIHPEHVDAALNRERRTGTHTRLRFSDPILVQLRAVTSLHIVDVGRSYRQTGMVIDQRQGAGPAWHYNELSRGHWILGVRAKLTETMIAAPIGGATERLIAPTPAIAATVIEEASERVWGTVQVKIAPDYRTY